MHLIFPQHTEYEKYAADLESMITADTLEMGFRKYFTTHPWILSLVFGHGEGAVFSEYELAPGQRPDHLLLSGRSIGAEVILVELKRPSAKLLKADGSMADALNNAITKTVQRQALLLDGKLHYMPLFTRQLDDLISRRKQHFQGVVDPYIQSKLRFPLEHYTVSGRIVIGSRELQSEEERMFRRSYYHPALNIELVPFDRILDFLRHPPHEAQSLEWLPQLRATRRARYEEERLKRADVVLAVPKCDEELSYPSHSGHEGRFRARIFVGTSRTVVLLTDIPYGTYQPSVTNNIERVVHRVCERFGLSGRGITFIEHYDNRDERLTVNFVFASESETFDQVTFQAADTGPRKLFTKPRWEKLSKADVERLIGGGLP
jgi:hypothetical protein